MLINSYYEDQELVELEVSPIFKHQIKIDKNQKKINPKINGGMNFVDLNIEKDQKERRKKSNAPSK